MNNDEFTRIFHEVAECIAWDEYDALVIAHGCESAPAQAALERYQAAERARDTWQHANWWDHTNRGES